MRIEKLGLEHQEILQDLLKATGIALSEYSFACLYLFRKNHGYEVLFDDEIFVRGRTYDGFDYIMPTRDIRNIDPAYLEHMIKEHGILFPVPEEWTAGLDVGMYSLEVNDGDTDYIHTVEKMGSYSGKKLHSKKNLLNQFLDSYDHRALPLTDDRLPDARLILEEWQKNSGSPHESTDYNACTEALELYERLVLCGGIFYADERPAGFIIGEELNEQTFALHFAKADTSFKGVFQYIFNSFARVLPSKYCCLNFEQDMGIESLRQSKKSYKPEKLLKKYRVSIR
ncbi:MAG: DUF2156 domain-containing protein [Spirochaetes bacterium]|jgi:hypothetical protein|nr:DUF2156 domain-containing protein [Spirochaetota bacterium]